MMVAAFYRTYNWKKRKQVLLQMHYWKMTEFSIMLPLIIIETQFRKANTYFI
jgi:hypothetical protein